MASKEELKRQDQINAAKQEEIRLEKELAAARQRSNAVKEDDLGISSGIIEVLKESVGIKSKVNQFDSNLFLHFESMISRYPANSGIMSP